MHGPHLPTGTDAVRAEGTAEMIAELEPVIILPTLYLNLNDQMKAYPGTIAMSPRLVGDILRELCSEAARNGFRKIVFLIAHGGVDVRVPVAYGLARGGEGLHGLRHQPGPVSASGGGGHGVEREGGAGGREVISEAVDWDRE